MHIPIVKVQDSFCEQLLLHFVIYPNILYIIEDDKQQENENLCALCQAKWSSYVINEKEAHMENKIEHSFFFNCSSSQQNKEDYLSKSCKESLPW